MKNNNNPSAWMKIEDTITGYYRELSSDELPETFHKYPGIDTNKKASIVFKETRYNIILCGEKGIGYAMLVLTNESDSTFRTDSSFYEVKWTDATDSKLCIGYLVQIVKDFIYSEKNRFALVGGEA